MAAPIIDAPPAVDADPAPFISDSVDGRVNSYSPKMIGKFEKTDFLSEEKILVPGIFGKSWSFSLKFFLNWLLSIRIKRFFPLIVYDTDLMILVVDSTSRILLPLLLLFTTEM